MEKKCLVGVKDVGSMGLLTNKGFLNLFEEVACIHSDIAGFGINQMKDTNLSWILLHWKVKVFKRVKYNSTVTVKTWSRNASKCLTYRDFEMYDENGNLICIATTKWTLVTVSTGAITKITPEIINCYHPEDDHNVFGQLDIEKLKEPEVLSHSDIKPSYTFTVLRRDIDVNKHMHNSFYLDYAIEALPQEIYESLESNQFEIMYKNGAKLGDTVNCYYAKQEGGHYVVMKNAKGGKLNAIVRFN